jgi:rSAM/selenodomain-associated transferase 1
MPTLIVFAKEPRAGRVKSRLAASCGEHAACRLYRSFLTDLAEAFRTFDAPVEWWVDGDPGAFRSLLRGALSTSYRQPSGDLGARLEAAFRSAFRRRAGPVAVIGTDCPLLRPTHVRALLEAVGPSPQGTQAALIPAEDGGYAGLALASPAPEAFAGVPWSTARVAAVTAAKLRAGGRKVALLPALYDVDTAADAERLWAELAENPGLAPATAATLGELVHRAGGRWPEKPP